ncbi:MAG TPA: hypothetical protein VNO24_00870 [Blastocatellia bacterium]|nr:hypothetical protein [Blastocatellia bacterium]
MSKLQRYSVGVTCSPTAIRARLEQTGHSYGVTESLSIAVLSRGHSYEFRESPGIVVLSKGHSYGVVPIPRDTTPVEDFRGCNSRSYHTASALVGFR